MYSAYLGTLHLLLILSTTFWWHGLLRLGGGKDFTSGNSVVADCEMTLLVSSHVIGQYASESIVFFVCTGTAVSFYVCVRPVEACHSVLRLIGASNSRSGAGPLDRIPELQEHDGMVARGDFR